MERPPEVSVFEVWSTTTGLWIREAKCRNVRAFSQLHTAPNVSFGPARIVERYLSKAEHIRASPRRI